MSRITSLMAVVSLLACCRVATPESLNFQIVQGGPLRLKQAIQPNTKSKWVAKVQDGAPWLSLLPEEGTGSTPLTVLLNSSAEGLTPGDHAAKIAVSFPGEKETAVVDVNLKVVPRAPGPKFTYISGPTGCTQPAGYPDAAVCVPPGERPAGDFTPPPVGGSYKDPNFGATIKILAKPVSLHGYSSPSALSPSNKYAVVSLDGDPSIIDVQTGKRVARVEASFEGVMWDPKDDDIYYYLDGTKVKSHSVARKKTTTLVDYSKAPWKFPAIKTGSRGDTSKDNWIPFFVPGGFTICALDVNTVTTYCGSYAGQINGVSLDDNNGGALIAKGVDSGSGKRYVFLVANPAIALYSVNTKTGKLDFETLGPELPDWNGNGNGRCDPGEACLKGTHADTFEDEKGIQYMLGSSETQHPCEYSMSSFQLNTGMKMTAPVELGGGRKRLITLFKCGGVDVWTDWHAGCAKLSPYCVISTTYADFQKQRNVTDKTPIHHTAHMGEIFVIKGNGLEVRRLMEHRSVPLTGEEAQSYWATPRANISNDGAYVVADSNFGFPGQYRVVLIETGYGPAAAH